MLNDDERTDWEALHEELMETDRDKEYAMNFRNAVATILRADHAQADPLLIALAAHVGTLFQALDDAHGRIAQLELVVGIRNTKEDMVTEISQPGYSRDLREEAKGIVPLVQRVHQLEKKTRST